MVTWEVDLARVVVLDRGTDLALELADRVCRLAADRAAEGRSVVLGLAAGATPRGTYRALRLRRRTGLLDLRRATAFGLDEYYPINPRAEQSFTSQLTHVAAELGLPLKRLNLLRGDIPRDRIAKHCAEYELAIRRAGGIDLQLLGVGRNGHLGFNEPGAGLKSRTRLVELSEQTRNDAAQHFGGLERTPYKAITMGLGTILEAREIALLAIGIHKAAIVKRVLEEEPSAMLPASLLRLHRRVTFYLDSAAASLLAAAVSPPEIARPPGPPREALQ
jgi:glucosamine-6-phosphate deaminase